MREEKNITLKEQNYVTPLIMNVGVAHYVGVALTCCLGRSTCTPGRVSMDSPFDGLFCSWWAESRLPGGGSVRFLLGSGRVGVGSGNGGLILSPLMGRVLFGSGGAGPP